MCRIVWTMTAALPAHRIVGPQVCERAPARVAIQMFLAERTG